MRALGNVLLGLGHDSDVFCKGLLGNLFLLAQQFPSSGNYMLLVLQQSTRLLLLSSLTTSPTLLRTTAKFFIGADYFQKIDIGKNLGRTVNAIIVLSRHEIGDKISRRHLQIFKIKSHLPSRRLRGCLWGNSKKIDLLLELTGNVEMQSEFGKAEIITGRDRHTDLLQGHNFQVPAGHVHGYLRRKIGGGTDQVFDRVFDMSALLIKGVNNISTVFGHRKFTGCNSIRRTQINGRAVLELENTVLDGAIEGYTQLHPGS